MAYDKMGNYYDEETLTEDERRLLQTTGSLNPMPSAAPATPVSPTEYNQYIAKNESGNKPDIGYHMPGKSTAYGTYGITAGAYKDVQAANPAFAGRDITSLTPEEQTQAMNTFTQQNTKYLQNYGVEPTQGNLALAHFLGAKGAADYLRDGTISKAAAAANGGEDKVRQIADQRLSLGNAPVSGAAQPAAPATPVAPNAAVEGAPVRPVQPGVQVDDEGNALVTLPSGQTQVLGPDGKPLANRGINIEQAAQFDPFAQRLLESANDTKSLMALGADANAPAWVQSLAQDQARERLTLERDKERETAKIKEMAAKGDTTGLARMISQQKEGSWGRAILFGLLGGGDLAREEIAKMGYGSQLQKGSINGQDVVYSTTPMGEAIQGYYASGPLAGQALDNQSLGIVAAGGGSIGKTKPDVSTQDVEATINGQTVKGRVVTTYNKNNQPTTQVESGGKFYAYDGKWKPVSISTAGEKAVQQKQINLAWDPIIKAATTSADELTKAGIKYGLNLGIAGYGSNGAPIIIDKNTNQILQPNAQGQVTVTQSGVAGALPPGGTQSLATGAAVSEAAQKQFVEKTVPALIEEGSNGSSVASIRRQQISLINSNPSILGIYNGTGEGYDRARNVITKAITGAYGQDNSQELYDDLKKVTGLREGERAALEDFANMNMSINSKTLKANTGGGQISNAEQKINKDANLSNIAQQTPLASLQGLYRSQFAGELAAAKQAFATANPDLNTDAKFAAAWNKEQAKLIKSYEGIMEARAEYLKPFRPREGASAAELNAFKDKIFKAFEMYPAPTYNSENNKWSYGTANAERAAARKLLGR